MTDAIKLAARNVESGGFCALLVPVRIILLVTSEYGIYFGPRCRNGKPR